MQIGLGDFQIHTFLLSSSSELCWALSEHGQDDLSSRFHSQLSTGPTSESLDAGLAYHPDPDVEQQTDLALGQLSN